MRESDLQRLSRTIRDDERGMTLIELLVGISLGLVVTLAAYLAIDAANRNSTRTAMRIDTVQRGRNAMEDMSRAIRAQQCYNGTRPMLWAAGSAMEFYSSIAPIAATTFQPVERHRIQWEAKSTPSDLDNGGRPVGDLREYIWRLDPVSNRWQTNPTIRTLAEDVEQAPDRRNNGTLAPIFNYYKYDGGVGSGRIDYSSPVGFTTSQNGLPSAPAGDLAGIVLVELSYRVSTRRTKAARAAGMNFYNTVSVRIADPTNPGGSPQCL